MAQRKISKGQLIEKAGEMFRIHGYHNCSIADIAKYCDLSKSSVYHHVSSKQELAKLAIEQVHQYFKENIFSLAYNKNASLDQFNEAVQCFFANRKGGSLMANLVAEIAETEPAFKPTLKAYFDDWIAAVACLLKTNHDEKEAGLLAKQNVAQQQGMLLLNRIC